MTGPPENSEVKLPQVKRLGSIDAYRGLVMFLMMAEVLRLPQLAAKFPNSSLWQFLGHHQSHVPWAGCSLHDLIQPSFSFLVGVSLPFSLARRASKGQSRAIMLAHAVWRAIVLVLLGVFLRSMGRPQTNWTFEDTLSQIGFGYVPLFLLGLTRQRWQWVALLIILVGYWGAFAMYVPPGDFDYEKVGVPSDWEHHYTGLAAHWNKNSNLAWAFDTWFLNLFPRDKPFTHNRGGYATLSFIPTLATMILGLIAGGWLVGWASRLPDKEEAQSSDRLHQHEAQASNPWRTIGWLTVTGAVLLATGIAADRFGICPNVKRIWTPSWVLFSGGWCFFLLAAFYAVIDAGGRLAWSFPLRVIGANSIAAYLLAHGPDQFIKDSIQLHFGPKLYGILGDDYKTLVAGMIVLLVEWLILYWLYRQRIHIRI
jgi:heparan-alpha-glucosaminide N-acetyltransferase